MKTFEVFVLHFYFCFQADTYKKGKKYFSLKWEAENKKGDLFSSTF